VFFFVCFLGFVSVFAHELRHRLLLLLLRFGCHRLVKKRSDLHPKRLFLGDPPALGCPAVGMWLRFNPIRLGLLLT